MRTKDKLFCDECGVFIRYTIDDEKDQITKDRLEGSRTNLSIICRKCLVKNKVGTQSLQESIKHGK